jgi:uncharacterized protein YqfA (UPF0365 family)
MKEVTVGKYSRVRALIEEGAKLSDALKKAKMSAATYYKMKNAKGDTKVVVHSVKATPRRYVLRKKKDQSPDWVVITTSANLKNVMDELR